MLSTTVSDLFPEDVQEARGIVTAVVALAEQEGNDRFEIVRDA